MLPLPTTSGRQTHLYLLEASTYFSLTSSGKEANLSASFRSLCRFAGYTVGRSVTTINPRQAGSLPNAVSIEAWRVSGLETRSVYDIKTAPSVVSRTGC